MSNPIKYNTGSESLALKKGNFYIGTGDVGKGPSNVTGYYQGPDVPSGGYVIYLYNSGQPSDLSYHSAANDNELISFTNNLAGQSYTTVNECLTYYAGQTDKMVLNRDYESIVTDGLVFNVDAGFTASYPKNGNTIKDISTNSKNGTLKNGPNYSTNNGGVIVFDGTNDRLPITANASDLNLSGSFTIQMVLKPYVVSPSVANSTNKGLFLCPSSLGVAQNRYLHILIRNDVFMFGFFSNDLYDNGNTLTANNWYIVNFRFDNTTKLRSIWVNGNKNVEQNAGTNMSLGTGSVTICGVYNQPFNGEMLSTIVYNRALSDEEIVHNFNVYKSRVGL